MIDQPESANYIPMIDQSVMYYKMCHMSVTCVIARNLFYFIIYTDDTTLSLSTTLEIVIRNSPNLNADDILSTVLKNVNDWLKLNKLSLNLTKCKYMIFNTHRKK